MTTWPSSHKFDSAQRSGPSPLMIAGAVLLVLLGLRLFWSGSWVWFLVLGVLCVGWGAVLYLAGQQPPSRMGKPTRPLIPSIMMGLGAALLALLVVPSFGGGSGDTDNESVSNAPVTISTPVSQVAGAVATPKATTTAAASNGQGQTYTVKSGDSLYAISQQLGITVDAIMKANNLSSADLSIGQKLVIPAAAH